MSTNPTMRAKFQVVGIEPMGTTHEKVTFRAVGGKFPYPEDGSDEDNTYAKFSPQADCSIVIANPALLGKFTLNEKFYVDFTKAEA